MAFESKSSILSRLVLGALTVAEFSTASLAQGFGAWSQHRDIKLNTSTSGASVTGKVDKFPVGINLTPANFDFSKANADGSDLRFSTAAGAALPHEIEMWDKAGSKAAVWVKVDVTGSSPSQAITMHWGNPAAANVSDGKAVFDKADGFIGAYHLSETGSTTEGGYKDATANQAHATGVNLGPENTVPGRIGQASNNENAKKSWIKVENDKTELFNPKTPSWTVSIWITVKSFPATGQYHTFFSKGDISWTMQRIGKEKTFENCNNTDGGHACSITTREGKTDGSWHLFHGIFVKDQSIKLWMNGTSDDFTPWKPKWRTGPQPLAIGTNSQKNSAGVYPDRYWDGILDEARVMEGSKDEHWIKLDYESQKNGSKFLEFQPIQSTFVRRSIPGYFPDKPEMAIIRDVMGRYIPTLSGIGYGGSKSFPVGID